MNKSEMVRALAEKHQLGVIEVEKIVDSLTEMIAVSLACGEPVLITKFGKFEPREKNEVVRRNPRTGEEIFVPKKKSVLFRASPSLKERINK